MYTQYTHPVAHGFTYKIYALTHVHTPCCTRIHLQNIRAYTAKVVGTATYLRVQQRSKYLTHRNTHTYTQYTRSHSKGDESSDVFKGYRKGLAPCFATETLKKSFPLVRFVPTLCCCVWISIGVLVLCSCAPFLSLSVNIVESLCFHVACPKKHIACLQTMTIG